MVNEIRATTVEQEMDLYYEIKFADKRLRDEDSKALHFDLRSDIFLAQFAREVYNSRRTYFHLRELLDPTYEWRLLGSSLINPNILLNPAVTTSFLTAN